MFTSGDFLLSNLGTGLSADAPVVVNDRTGAITALDPTCQGDAVGAPWVLMSCPQSSTTSRAYSGPSGAYDTELYSLADGTRQVVTPNPVLPQCQWPAATVVHCNPGAVGAYWIRWDAGCYHCASSLTGSFFENIQTGEVRSDPTNQTTYTDLNSPNLAQTTCPGVQLLPQSVPDYPPGWGSLSSYGQFALATGTDSAGIGAFLERCGTSMRRLLASGTSPFSLPDLFSNASAVVWQTGYRQLNGLFLPSLQAFTIPVPSAFVASSARLVGLTSGALYMRGFGGTLWRAASPTALPLNMRRPRVTRSGITLTCVRGSWRNASQFSYAWRAGGTTERDAKPKLALGKSRTRRSVSCSVTAANAMGTTTASSASLHVRGTAAQ